MGNHLRVSALNSDGAVGDLFGTDLTTAGNYVRFSMESEFSMLFCVYYLGPILCICQCLTLQCTG